MKQDNKNKELQERQRYVPASVKVIEITVQKVMCTSPALGSVNDPWRGSGEEEI